MSHSSNQLSVRQLNSATSLYSYNARYYDPAEGRFLSEDPSDVATLRERLNLYSYVLENPANFSDPLGLFTRKSPLIPWPNLRLQALLECIEFKTGIPLVVTSTTEGPPLSPHGPNDVHRRGDGLAVDIHYPSNPDAVLCAAESCGAVFALDEKKHPSSNSNAGHIHLQLVPGPANKNDLPKDPKCKGCS